MLLHFVADYAPGDLAFAEVMTQLSRELPPTWRVHISSVKSFDTVSIGFVTAQLADTPARPERMVIYSNCAPRRDLSAARRNNDGEPFEYLQLMNGVEILGVASGHSLSFVKNTIAKRTTVRVSSAGSQFRSRDLFPAAVGKLCRGDYSFQGEALDTSAIPDYPIGVIGYTDSFGNIKTTFRSKDLSFEPGSTLTVTIGTTSHDAILSDGIFNVPAGTLSLSPGSSGGQDRFYEISLRGDSASQMFGNPPAGAHIAVRLA